MLLKDTMELSKNLLLAVGEGERPVHKSDVGTYRSRFTKIGEQLPAARVRLERSKMAKVRK